MLINFSNKIDAIIPKWININYIIIKLLSNNKKYGRICCFSFSKKISIILIKNEIRFRIEEANA